MKNSSTKAQRDALDQAVFNAIKLGYSKASRIQAGCYGTLVDLFGGDRLTLSHMRAVDRSLQRLQKIGCIRYESGHWTVFEGARRRVSR